MGTLNNILIALVALLHLWFMWIEMFAWETTGRKVFRKNLQGDLFKPTKKLAANQGLYNGFLAAGLFWCVYIGDELWKVNLSVFFLSCVTVAGIYGALTVDKKIFFIQALPAVIALILTIVLSV